jgi:hypothetical protein
MILLFNIYICTNKRIILSINGITLWILSLSDLVPN